MNQNFKMTRGNRTSRERKSMEIAEPLEQNDSEDSVSVRNVENTNVKHGGIPLQKRWTSSEDSSRSHSPDIKTTFRHKRSNIEDTETESLNIKSNDKSHKSEEHFRGKASSSDIRASEERVTSKSGKARRKKHSKRREVERRSLGKRGSRTADRDQTDTGFSARRYSEDNVTDKSRRRKQDTLRADDEIPITEILKKVQEDTRTKYEEPVPLPELTTDTIYIQGRNGFNAMKIDGLRRVMGEDTIRTTKGEIRNKEDHDFTEIRTHTLIKVAIMAQKFWKCTGLIYQGLLGGMALLHFIMIHIFFNTSMEFILNYSIFSEVYTNIFSFLIVLCVVTIFDKFDLAHLNMDYLREIYMDHAKNAIAIPLYLITFSLHQATSKVDDQLALMHYHNHINETMWSNNTMLETFFDELRNWQKITMSKDLLALLAWLFVALGTRDNMLLMHLESMEKYASNIESPR